MKIEFKLFAILAAFFGIMAVIYGLWSDWKEPVGPVALLQVEGEFGFFSPYSWWPLWLGLTAALCFLGLAVGWWLFIIGASLGVFAVIGWTFEYFKGEHAL